MVVVWDERCMARRVVVECVLHGTTYDVCMRAGEVNHPCV